MNAKKEHTTVHRGKDAITLMEDFNVLVSFSTLKKLLATAQDDLNS